MRMGYTGAQGRLPDHPGHPDCVTLATGAVKADHKTGRQ